MNEREKGIQVTVESHDGSVRRFFANKAELQDGALRLIAEDTTEWDEPFSVFWGFYKDVHKHSSVKRWSVAIFASGTWKKFWVDGWDVPVTMKGADNVG